MSNPLTRLSRLREAAAQSRFIRFTLIPLVSLMFGAGPIPAAVTIGSDLGPPAEPLSTWYRNPDSSGRFVLYQWCQPVTNVLSDIAKPIATSRRGQPSPSQGVFIVNPTHSQDPCESP